MKKNSILWVGRSRNVSMDWAEVHETKPKVFSSVYGTNPMGIVKLCYKQAYRLTDLTLRLGEIKSFRVKFIPVRRKK